MARHLYPAVAALALFSASLAAQSNLAIESEIQLRAAYVTTIVLQGDTTSGEEEFGIDSADRVVIQVSTNSPTMAVSLVDPSSVEHASGVPDAIVTDAEVRGALEGSESSRVHTFVLSNPPAGLWKFKASESESFAGPRVAVMSLESSSSLVIGLLGAGRDYPIGRAANPAIVLFDADGPVLSDNLTRVTGKLFSESGFDQDIVFVDDGAEPDAAANDGIYSSNLVLSEPGVYTVAASVRGTRGGEPFDRAVAEDIRVTEPCVTFSDELSTEVVDDSGDEIPEGILVKIPVNVTREGGIHALVLLEAEGGATVSFNSRPDLTVGVHTVEVRFEASLLVSLQADGPYQIKEVSLSCLGDDGYSLSEIAHALGDTPPFALSETGLQPTVELASLNESAVDDDSNGKFDRLNVAVEFSALPVGEYDWRAVLADPMGGHIASAMGSGLLGGGNLTANVSFAGTAIGSHAVDGPYDIVGIELFGPEGTEVLTRIGATRAYTFDQFEGAPDRPAGPSVGAGGVVDAASFGSVGAPGGIGSLFGADLAAAVDVATDVPLPRSLQGLQVLVDGRIAPLFFVSSAQVNFQFPFETATNRNAEVVVVRDELTSNVETVRVEKYAPAMFVNPSTGEPIVTRHPDGALIAAGNPARSEDVLTLFVNGVGDVTNVPATGTAAGVPLSTATVTPTVTVGGVPAQVLFAGLAPFFVGLAQINIIMPNLGTAGGPAQNLAALPLVVEFAGAQSKPVNLPVSTPVVGAPDISLSAVAIDFGNVSVGQTSDQTLTIGNTGSAPLAVSGIAFNDPQFSVVQPAGAFNVAPGGSQLVAFRFAPTTAAMHEATLTIASNDPTNPMLSITVRGISGSSMVGNLTPSEQMVDFGSVETGQTSFRVLTLQNSGTAAVTIEQVSVNSGEFTAALQVSPSGPQKATPLIIQPGGNESLLVTFAPTSAGSKQAEVTIQTDITSQPVLTVGLSGTGTAPSANGTIVVPTGPLSFGGTPLGRTREITITVHNAGSADLTVNSVLSDDPQFTLGSPEAPFVVTPDERLPLRLHYTPSTLGVTNATLSFESSDPSTPTATVAVTGRGEEGAEVIFSDSFDRDDSTVPCDLGRSDNLVGGSTSHRYTFILQGAALRSNEILNSGRPRGGIQFTTERAACPTRGTDMGQDLNIRADVMVPQTGERNTQAGPFFRGTLLTTGTDLLGTAGFWVALDSSGEVRVRQLNPDVVIGTSPAPVGFDSSIPHSIEISVLREKLEVAVDGKQRTFTQGNLSGRRQVTLQPTVGMNEGGAGIAFGADAGPATTLGQTLDNLLVTEFEPLTGLPVED